MRFWWLSMVFREDALKSNTLWSIALSERQNILSPDISSKINLKKIILTIDITKV